MLGEETSHPVDGFGSRIHHVVAGAAVYVKVDQARGNPESLCIKNLIVEVCSRLSGWRQGSDPSSLDDEGAPRQGLMGCHQGSVGDPCGQEDAFPGIRPGRADCLSPALVEDQTPKSLAISQMKMPGTMASGTVKPRLRAPMPARSPKTWNL